MSPRRALAAVVVVGIWAATATTARGQLPQPRIRDVEQRSGLLTRFKPIPQTLPPDRDRDQWYDTRWADKPGWTHVNGVLGLCHGGLYGLRWASRDTACVYPFFRGSPGVSTITPESEPARYDCIRLYDNFLHPWRPVGMYYQKGCYVPIYDLDPLVVGPGPFPYRHFLNAIKGG